MLNFNNTQEAIQYGLEHKGDMTAINKLRLFYSIMKLIAKESAKKDEQVCLNILSKAQFIREAMETAEGKPI